MEFDDLKDIWQKGDHYKTRGEKEIADMLKGRSHSIITKLKRNIRFELIVTLIGSALIVYYAFSIPNQSLRWASIVAFLAFLGYIIYYVKKISLLNRFEVSQGNIRTNLEELVNNLEIFLKFYYRSYTVLYPAYLVLMVILAIADHGMSQFVESLKDWRVVVYMLFLIFFTIVLLLWISKWYLRELYGRHLAKLRALLVDLQEPA